MPVTGTTCRLFNSPQPVLAAGLLLKRKGLRGGCTPAPGNDHECQCKGEKGSDSKSGSREAIQDQELRKEAENLET